MRGFRRDRGRLVAELGPVERGVLAAALADVVRLLGAEDLLVAPEAAAATDEGAVSLFDEPLLAGGSPPTDPALRRLFPDASRADPAVSAEFRRYTQGELRQEKARRLAALWRSLAATTPGWGPGDLVFGPGEAQDAAAALTDLRLVLGARLGLRDEADAADLAAFLDEPDAGDDGDPGSARRHLGVVHELVGWLLESLLVHLLADLDDADS